VRSRPLHPSIAVSLSLRPFFFLSPAPPEIYTLSLHDALPIFLGGYAGYVNFGTPAFFALGAYTAVFLIQSTRAPLPVLILAGGRSEEHTSELQSPDHLVCRLLLEKKKKTKNV